MIASVPPTRVLDFRTDNSTAEPASLMTRERPMREAEPSNLLYVIMSFFTYSGILVLRRCLRSQIRAMDNRFFMTSSV